MMCWSCRGELLRSRSKLVRIGASAGGLRENDDYAVPLFPLRGTIEMAERVRDGIHEIGRIWGTNREVLVAADGSLHPGMEMLEVET